MSKCLFCKKQIPWEPIEYFNDSGEQCCMKCYDEIQADKKRKRELEEWKKRQKIREHTSSHCHTCNKKSTFFHFIYDKRLGKVWDSWSNAPDPDSQLVFCNQTCFNKYMEKENAYICSSCGKKGSGNYVYSKTDPERKKFCSNSCWKTYVKKKVDEANQVDQEEIDALNEKMDDLNQQQIKNLQELMKGGHDLDFDFENASWLNEKQKAICREYQKNREEVKRLKKQKESIENEDLSNGDTGESSNDNENQKTCSKCGSNGVKYEHKTKNDGKKFCSQTCFSDYYYLKDNSNSNDSPNQSPNSPSSSNDTPQEISSDSSPDSNSPIEEPKPKKKLITGTKENVMRYAKLLISRGSRVEDIDTSSLTPYEISELRDYESKIERGENPDKNEGTPSLGKKLVIGCLILVPIILIITLVVLRKKKPNRLKKRN